MASITDFDYFDPSQEYTVTYGDLPHWEQVGATQFITFRTADSLPASVVERWKRDRDGWLNKQTKTTTSLPWFEKFKMLSPAKKEQFNRIFRHELELQLDKGRGSCLLRRECFGRIVADSLKHFDGQRYYLGDFIVMPNHVHVLVSFFRDVRLREQCYSWKHFTAGKINKLRGVQGEFWQTESFDHLVRNAENFIGFQKYIRENPVKAGLKEGEFIHYEIS